MTGKLAENQKINRYIKFYKKNLFGLKRYAGRGKPLLESLQIDFSNESRRDFSSRSSDHCLNYKNNLTKLIREKEKDTLYFYESQMEVLSIDKIIEGFAQWCEDNISKDLLHLKFSDVIDVAKYPERIDGQKEICKTYDMQEDSDIPQKIITLYIPFFKDDFRKIQDKLKDLATWMHKCGYDLTNNQFLTLNKFYSLRDDVEIAYVTFEPEFSEYQFEFSEWLYHVTPLSNLQKIQVSGIVPMSRNKSFSYPERIYLFNNCDMQFIIDYGIEKTQDEDQDEFVLLRISSEKLQKDARYISGDIDFYIDQKYPNIENKIPMAIYTTKPIQKDLIDDLAISYKLKNRRIVEKREIKFR